jgi:putative membrane protein
MAGPISRSSITAPAGFVRLAGSSAMSLAGMLVLPLGVSAHTSQAVAPRDLMQFWTPDPAVVVACLVSGWLYLRGAGKLREIGERTGRGSIIPIWRVVAFWCGLATLLIALASPLDTATATIFSAHMVQHIMLISVGPPLILLGNPMTVIMNGLPRPWRRPIAQLEHRVPGLAPALRILTAPIVAFVVHVSTLWIWHFPPFYDAAVRHESLHLVEHATFVMTAFLYWWKIIPATRVSTRTVSPAVGILSVFAMGMQGAVLGTILTFSGSVLYPVYSGRSELWGISTISDQRLAGLIMWIPAGSVYVGVAMLLLALWFREEEDDTESRNEGTLQRRIGDPKSSHIAVG